MEPFMRRAMIFLLLISGAMLIYRPATRAEGMKSSAPEKMLPPDEAKKMRACDARAMQEKIPMERRARFVKQCMAKMK
jgi:hypothetical protein